MTRPVLYTINLLRHFDEFYHPSGARVKKGSYIGSQMHR